MVVELIAKDKNEKFEDMGKCKIIIDSLSKMLLVEPFNEEYKMISAMLKWKFVAQKNILFVFAEHDFQDFALIFDNTKICNKIFGFLLKKGASIGDKELIFQHFLSLIFNEISANNESSKELKEILFKWIEFFDGQEKEGFIQILKDNNIYGLFYSSENQQTNPRKRKARDIYYEKHKSTGPNICGTGDSKRKIANSKRRQLKYTIIEEPNFEIFKYVQKGRSKTKLSIFPSSEDRKYCYEYFWSKSKKYFTCCACHNRKKRLIAKIIKKNGKDVVKLNKSDHVCKLRKYKEIIEKPNFEVFLFEYRQDVRKKLIIFLDSSRDYCYEYSWINGNTVFSCHKCRYKNHYQNVANICQKKDGTEFVMLKSNDHVCEPQKFNREKYGEKEIVEAKNFKIYKEFRNGIDKSKLVIFASSDQSTCYEYFWHRLGKIFLCIGCINKKNRNYVAAKLCIYDNGSNFIKLSKKKHTCESREFKPEKFDNSKKEIVKSSNFRIFKCKNNGVEISKLIVFCETNKNLCYEYYWKQRSQLYQCAYCPWGKRPTATVCQTEDSKDYLILDYGEHVCNLREFDPEKYRDDVIVDKSMYKFSSTTAKILVIFTNEEKKFYYKFVYHNQRKHYYCSRCYYSKLIITATIQNEGKENEFAYVSNQKHICEPFESLIYGNIILALNFQFVKRKHKGNIVQHMAIFTNKDKTECYDYTWDKQKMCYVCGVCQYQHKNHVYSKIFKNEKNEECVELCGKPHKCKPIKFVPENIPATKIVKEPYFKLHEIMYRGKSCKKLAIFDSKNPNRGFTYSYLEKLKKYICYRCKSRNTKVTAKVLQDENVENYLELNDNEHVCELQII